MPWHRAVQRDVASADLLREDRDVAVRGRKDDPVPLERLEVLRRRQRRRDPELGYGGVVRPIGTVYKGDARIFDAERLVGGGRNERGGRFDVEVDAVRRSRHAKVRDRRQPGATSGDDDAWIAQVDVVRVAPPPPHVEPLGGGVIHCGRNFAWGGFPLAFRDPQQRHDLSIVTSDGWIEDADDFQLGARRLNHCRRQNRVFCCAAGDRCRLRHARA